MVERTKIADSLALIGGCTVLNRIDFIGEVVSGRGEGKKYLEVSWVKQQITEKLGFNPFLGTLNLQLDEESVKQKKLLVRDAALGVCTSEGYCTGLLFKAYMHGLACGVVIPLVENYPNDELEVVAEVNLRQKLMLHDGDMVEVTVFL